MQPAPKESWVDGFLQANRLIPQRATPTVPLLTLDAILRNQPDYWNELSISRLSDEQVTRVGERMNRMHHKQGVHYATAEAKTDEDSLVTDGTIRGLWHGAVENVYDLLGNYVTTFDPNNQLPNPRLDYANYGQYYKRINTFMDNSDNAEHVTLLQSIVSDASSILKSSENAYLRKRHYQEVVEGHRGNKSESVYRATIDRPQFGEQAVDILSKKVLSALQEKYASENVAWLYPTLRQE